jgi:hypothetical protein
MTKILDNKKIQIFVIIFLICFNIALFYYLVWQQSVKVNYIVDELPRNGEYPLRDLDKVDRIILHHAGCCCHDNCNAEMYANVHINERGWAGIGYHFVIEKDAKLYQTNDINRASTHTQQNNMRGIGVCLSGDFTQEKLPSDMRKTLIKTLKYLRRKYDIKEVWMHRDFHTTICPAISDNEFIEIIKKAGFKPQNYYRQ